MLQLMGTRPRSLRPPRQHFDPMSSYSYVRVQPTEHRKKRGRRKNPRQRAAEAYTEVLLRSSALLTFECKVAAKSAWEHGKQEREKGGIAHKNVKKKMKNEAASGRNPTCISTTTLVFHSLSTWIPFHPRLKAKAWMPSRVRNCTARAHRGNVDSTGMFTTSTSIRPSYDRKVQEGLVKKQAKLSTRRQCQWRSREKSEVHARSINIVLNSRAAE